MKWSGGGRHINKVKAGCLPQHLEICNVIFISVYLVIHSFIYFIAFQLFFRKLPVCHNTHKKMKLKFTWIELEAKLLAALEQLTIYLRHYFYVTTIHLYAAMNFLKTCQCFLMHCHWTLWSRTTRLYKSDMWFFYLQYKKYRYFHKMTWTAI